MSRTILSSRERALLTLTPALTARNLSPPGKYRIPPHIAHLDRVLVDIARSIKRGVPRFVCVEMPPRHGKSETTSKWFPPWFLSVFPDRQIILTSATDDLAKRFSAHARDIVREHGETLGIRLRRDMQSAQHWGLESGGSLRAAGVGGGIMGQGADVLIVDDFFKNHEEAMSETQRKKLVEWFLSTSGTRLSPVGSVILVATRWHADDLIGHVLRHGGDGVPRYERIRFPAYAEADDPLGRAEGEPLWPARYGREALEAKRLSYVRSGYEWMWEALYQQNPPSMLGSEFSPDYFAGDDLWWDEWPDRANIVLRVMALDPSLGKSDKSDYSSLIYAALDTEGIIWIDADLRRRDASTIAGHVVDGGEAFGPDSIAVEGNQFQALLADQIHRISKARGMALPIRSVIHTTDKRTRVRRLTPYLARQDFRFRRDSPGVALLIEQLKGFPNAKHDDGPDALEMAVDELRRLYYGRGDDGAEIAGRVVA